MEAVTTVGVRVVTPRDSRTASLIGGHTNAIKLYGNTGRTSHLRQYRNKTFTTGKTTYRLETDPKKLEELADAGELNFESIYVDVA